MLVDVAGDLLASHNREYDVEPPYDIAAAGDLPADRFPDRELSWLAFNERVLELAEDDRIPLLERARFLAIFASNLDEFYMVRVAGLKRRIAAGVAVRAAGGLLPRELLDRSLSREPRADGPAGRRPRGRRSSRRWPSRASTSCAGTTSSTASART